MSHAPLIDSKEPGLYRKPLAATRAYLDAIDATDNPVPVGNRVLAALGPKMLELSATRSRGAHPYLVTPDHTRYAREHLGDGPLLLPEQTVLLTEDEDEARKLGTDWLRAYLALPNYANNLLRSGFTQEDVDVGQRPTVRRDHRVGRRGDCAAPGERTPRRGRRPRLRAGAHRRSHGIPPRTMATAGRRAAVSAPARRQAALGSGPPGS